VYAPFTATTPSTVVDAPELMVTGPPMVNPPEMVSVLVDEKFGDVAPLIVKVPVFVTFPVPPTVEVAPETVTPPEPLFVPLSI